MTDKMIASLRKSESQSEIVTILRKNDLSNLSRSDWNLITAYAEELPLEKYEK